MRTRTFLVVWIFIEIASIQSFAVSDDAPRDLPATDTLQAVLDHIHTHAATVAWRNGSFKDEAIEAWLKKLVGRIAKEAEQPDLKLPVTFADVRPAPDGRQALQNVLIVGQTIRRPSTSFQNSVLLADGSVEVEGLRGCVVVARGAVHVRMVSEYSVIASGAFVKITLIDGDPRNPANGSLIATRGWADVGTPHGSLIAALQGVSISRTAGSGTVLINTPPPDMTRALGGRGNDLKSLKITDLSLEPLRQPSHTGTMAFLGAVRGERTLVRNLGGPIVREQKEMAPVSAVIRYEGRRYVADLDQPIVDEAGQPVVALQDWKLTFVDEKIAILSSDISDAVLRLASK